MMINIDFLAAGCSTRCKHCYVNGGPGPLMPLEDVLRCLERLDAIAALLPGETSFTLDHEPMNHPQVREILSAAARTSHIQNYHHGMTTGLGLMRRADREAVIRCYLDHGYRDFGVTIHGAAARHDEIVRRRGAFDAAVSAAGFLARMGCRVQISLMLNRYFAEDAEAISRLLEEVRPDDIWFADPIYTPHANMRDFEPYRASLETLEAIRPWLSRWRQDPEEVTETARKNTVGAARERLRELDLRRLWDQPQEELYLSLHPDCRLYVGNSGAETRCLGDLRRLDPAETAARLLALPGNRDYGAFYDPAALPSAEAVDRALEALPRDLVFGDFASVLYRAFDSLGVPTILLPAGA